jgi:multiple sugar transport system ATP-binding protein
MSTVTFSGVGKTYGDGTRAVRDLSLEIADGEMMVLVGPSGCGKTTALRMVAGLEEISEGEIRIDDVVVNDLHPQRRDIAMVFQNYALYPHMRVFDNIAFPLRSQRIARAEIAERVARIGQLLEIGELLKRKPGQLSGGQRQRVAMGRALVREPRVFLMDEPLSNLDAKLRGQMRAEIARLQRELGVTTIYVTHDQIEAMTMGSRIAVMRKGVLQQAASPRELYDDPANLFVASFVGTPPMNLVRARVVAGADGLEVTVGERRVPLSASLLARRPELAGHRDRELAMGIRPERVRVGASGEEGDIAQVRAEVKFVEALGFDYLVHLELDGEPVLSDAVLEVARDIDPATAQSLKHAAHHHAAPFVARVEDGAGIAVGDVVDVELPLAQGYYFDLATGESVARAATGNQSVRQTIRA